MPLSLQDAADRGLINELARLYADETNATMLLLAAGFPDGQLPQWTNPRAFWLAVCRAITSGGPPGMLEPVLTRAAAVFRDNGLLRSYRDHGTPPAHDHEDPEQEAAQAPRPVAEEEPRHHFLLVRGVNDVIALLAQARQLAAQHGHEPDSIIPAFANVEGIFLDAVGWEFEEAVALGNALHGQHPEYQTSVSATAFRDYMLQQLFVEGPDQQRYEINNIRASTPIRDVIQGVASNFYKGTASAMQSGRTVAVDLQSKSGESRRVNANNPLHVEKVQDGDTLEMHPDARAGAVHPADREAALVGAYREVMAFAEAHPGFEVLSNSDHAPTEYQFEFSMPGFAPPASPGDAPRPIDEHQVYLVLLADFPMKAPQAFWQTEIFHPNIHRATGKVCLGILDDHYVPGLDFGRLCQMLMDIAGYRNYAITEAYDEEALLWARSFTGQQTITARGGLPIMRMMLEEAVGGREPPRPLRIKALTQIPTERGDD